MGISNKNRKNLWAKSGNRCAICKIELFNNSTIDTFNIGEECHIISSQKNGPRYKQILEYDTVDNLILLCRNHHKEIDTLTETYNEELLRYIKQNHENWVNETLKLNTTKTQKAKFLFRITNGKELLEILSATGCRTDYDEIENEEEASYIGEICQNFVDYLDIIDLSEPFEKVKITLSLKNIIDNLETKGYFLFGEKKMEIHSFGGENQRLEIATLVIKKNDSGDIIKVDLKDIHNTKQ